MAAAPLNPCTLLGPLYPQPLGLQNDPIFQAAAHNLTQQLQSFGETSTSQWNTLWSNVTSFQAGLFSLDSPDLIFDFHWDAPNISLAAGAATTFDRDTRYPVGSVSKLFTVYTLLTEVGDGCWNHPVTDYVPELEQATADPSWVIDPINHVFWQDVTIGDLASQLGNVPHAPIGTPNTTLCPSPDPLECTRAQFFTNMLSAPPVQAPGTTALYSDDAFQVLAYAVENMTGKSYPDMVQQDIAGPLNMTRTSTNIQPINETYVNPYVVSQGFRDNGALGLDIPSGGVVSTLNDLSAMGRSILNSTLLPPALTRRWLKPHSNTADLMHPVGAPWEIARTTVNGRVIDIYTKEGDSVGYSTIIALLPDYNVGWVASAASSQPGPTDPSDPGAIETTNLDIAHTVYTAGIVTNQIAEIMVPAFEDAARDQAAAAYVGDYAAGEITLSISSDPGVPGLNLTSFKNGTTDLLTPDTGFAGPTVGAVTLQVTNLRAGSDIAFRAIPQSVTPYPDAPSILTFDCAVWSNQVDTLLVQAQPVDLFVFTLGANGNATGIKPRILGGLALERVN